LNGQVFTPADLAIEHAERLAAKLFAYGLIARV
jgi:hypothetical protein